MLQPLVRRTWAPRGQTPTLSEWDCRDRLSVISALTVSPLRRRLGLYFDILDHNIDTDDFETFIEQVLRRVRGRILLVLDRYSVHRSGVARVVRRFPKRVQVEWLPAYAPDLNPVEQVWNRAKRVDLANYAADDVLSLGRAAAASIRRTRSQPHLLRAFFEHCKLRL